MYVGLCCFGKMFIYWLGLWFCVVFFSGDGKVIFEEEWKGGGGGSGFINFCGGFLEVVFIIFNVCNVW